MTLTRVDASRREGTANGDPASDRAADAASDHGALAAVSRRISEQYPDTDPVTIDSMLAAAYRRTEHARVQNYRILLAEREARRRLRGDPIVDYGESPCCQVICVAAIDNYASEHGVESRSGVVQRAVSLLRATELGDDCAAAWAEWDGSDAADWERVVGDGLG